MSDWATNRPTWIDCEHMFHSSRDTSVARLTEFSTRGEAVIASPRSLHAPLTMEAGTFDEIAAWQKHGPKARAN